MRWGIVGTGAIAARFADACGRTGSARPVAVCSRSAETGQAFARAWGFEGVAEDAAALAARDDVEVVYVATPNHRHVDDVLAVIAAGKPVLCEKPLACDPDGAERIAAAARAAGVFCAEGMWSLCQPAYRDAFARIAAGEIGEVLEVSGSFATPNSPTAMPRLYDAAQGGGALLDLGVYLLALAGAVLGDLRLTHVTGDLHGSGVDRAATLICENAGGARAVLSTAIDRMGANGLTISGSRGRVSFAEPVSAPLSYRLTPADPDQGFKGPAGPSGKVAGLKAMLKAAPAARRLHQAFDHRSRWFGAGLEYEIFEVEAALGQGLTESALMPLGQSLAVQRLIAEARRALQAG
jgi:predicted dehydrogenase